MRKVEGKRFNAIKAQVLLVDVTFSHDTLCLEKISTTSFPLLVHLTPSFIQFYDGGRSFSSRGNEESCSPRNLTHGTNTCNVCFTSANFCSRGLLHPSRGYLDVFIYWPLPASNTIFILKIRSAYFHLEISTTIYFVTFLLFFFFFFFVCLFDICFTVSVDFFKFPVVRVCLLFSFFFFFDFFFFVSGIILIGFVRSTFSVYHF